jgi:ABC-type glycerol-3-phosphate transport system substrate-binding protein
MKRSFLIKLFTIVLALVLLTGCVGKTGVPATDTTTDTTTDTEKTSTETAAKDETSSGTETVVVWTCNTGNTGEWLTEAASRFNESQSKCIIQQEYAGSYQEVLAKLVASKPGDLPDVFHSDTEGSYTYVNKKDMLKVY